MRNASLALAGALLVCASCAGGKDVRPAPPWAVGKEVREGRVFTLSDRNLSLFDPRRPGADGLVLRIAPETIFVAGGRAVQRSDVEEGTPVRVYFEEGADPPLATRVEVMGSGG